MNTLNLFSQTELFDSEANCATEHFHTVVRRNGYRLDEVDIGDITFQSGQLEPIHRWYRLTPSFAPGLVRHFLKAFNADASDLVLDPFSGRGTTAIECQRVGIPSAAIEINPLLQIVGQYSLKWSPIATSLFDEFQQRLASELLANRKKALDTVIAQLNTSLPTIHDVFRWWRPNVLRNLIIAREIARETRFKSIYHYLWLAVNASALECANIHRNHPTITFDDDHNRHIDVLMDLQVRLRQIQEDLSGLTRQQRNWTERCQVVAGDSCDLTIALHAPHLGTRAPTIAITSPPYPNRFSYVHQTRPQLHFMELLSSRDQATEIDLRTIGGTWGRATSNLMKEHLEPPQHLLPMLDYLPQLRQKSTLMCNYATKYFIDLDRHARSLRSITNANFRAAYVVGNSRLSGIEIFTECILAKIFEYHDFAIERIVLFRKRGGRKRLYETAVCIKG